MLRHSKFPSSYRKKDHFVLLICYQNGGFGFTVKITPTGYFSRIAKIFGLVQVWLFRGGGAVTWIRLTVLPV
ncbi:MULTISPECIES: hypothetical protein [Providencia]|uniref:Uncharacterized protein n=1 Tax=Providencia stuartii TaxID=588 RepID=A0AAI9HW33_PROST|nr:MULTISPECIES: hypothetical protein [Providencia]ELR5034052.1 hypothetical protein [Providencia stuartii]QIC15682.1 hypothetical protein G3341_08300 [Providencia vermicola]